MNKFILFLMIFLLLLFLACACDSEDEGLAPDDDDSPTDGDAADDDDDDDDGSCSGGSVTLTDENNYVFSGTLDIQSYPLKEFSDVLFDWGGLTKDLQGHDLNPATDIDTSAIIVLSPELTEEDIEEGLSTNTLSQSAMVAYLSLSPNGTTQASLSEYTVFGNDIDIETYFEASYGNWLFTIATGDTPGVGTRMTSFLQPGAEATAESLTLTDDATLLTVDVDLTTLTPLAVEAGTANLSVDWSGLTAKGDGSEFVARDVDQVMVAHYASLGLSDLEEQFLDIELIADTIWTVSVSSGTTVDFANLYSATDDFTGIDDEGVWILALRCTTCANPAPPFLSILQPCP